MGPTDCTSLSETTRVTLEKTKVFSGLAQEVLSALRLEMQTRLMPGGEALYREGEPSESIFVVRSGLVTIQHGSEAGTLELESRGPGDVVGEAALIDVSPRYATAMCKTDTRIFELSRKQFFGVMAAYPQVAQHVLGVLSAKVRDAEVRRLRELEARTLELQRSLSDHQRLAIKGEMAAEIAHDLSNLMQALGGYMHLTEQEIVQNRPEQALPHLQRARQSFEHARLYADSLLHSTHPTGKKQLRNFNEFIAGQLEFLRPLNKLAGIVFKSDFDPQVSELSVDPFGIQLVLYTLVINAAEAMQSASIAHPSIVVQTRRSQDAGTMTLSVSDIGPGIDPSIREQLLQQRVSTKLTGHGFGLMNVARIVADHGGTITVRNLTPQGAEFTVSLPLPEGDH
jgi:signal transduction histidine kinase